MANISEDMANEDLNSVKFLLSNTLPPEKREKAKVKKISCLCCISNSSVCGMGVLV